MTTNVPTRALQLFSLVKPSGELEVSLARVEVPRPAANEVLVRIEAAPINPSDLGLLFGPADLSTVEVREGAVTAKIPERAMKGLATRVGVPFPVGNEGAGLVVAEGDDPRAKELAGKRVGALGGSGMYAQYRCVPVEQVLELPEGTTATQGAAAFINPLTALGMIETMRIEGHKALVHTAAASNLGQMLQRACIADGIPLVNVVRRKEQGEILQAVGAEHVVDTSSPTFMADLTEAIAKTGATLAFDAIGGGRLASQLLSAMEAAISRGTKHFQRYGSTTHKQVYIYGSLDPAPTELVRDFGLAWGIGGWLVTTFLGKVGAETAGRMRKRVGAELTTTFATSYAKEISLADMLRPEEIAVYAKRSTGGKYLVAPSRDGGGGGGGGDGDGVKA